jgi:golgi phosphoprotein 3
MTPRDELFLHEQVLLLAVHDEKGTVMPSALGLALAGALIAELLLYGRVAVMEIRRSKLLVVIDDSPMGEPLLDEALHRMATSRRRGSIATWTSRLATTRHLLHRVAEPLTRDGILRRESGRVLWVFSRTIYPTDNPTPERRLVDAVRAAVLGDDGDVAPRVAIVIALTRSSGILDHVLGRKTVRGRKHRLDALARMELVGDTAQDAILAARAAAATAALAATTAAAGRA